MKYFHMRYCFNENINDTNPRGVDCRGGVTIGMESVDENKVRYAIAFCSINDVYCRKLGRRIVEGRLKSGNCWQVDVDPTESWSDVLNKYVADKIVRYFNYAFKNSEQRELYFEALQ